jgi:hypothetical protein
VILSGTHYNLYVSKSLIDEIQSFFSVRKSYVIQIIEEWYDETMVPEFEKIIGESGLHITDINDIEEHSVLIRLLHNFCNFIV